MTSAEFDTFLELFSVFFFNFLEFQLYYFSYTIYICIHINRCVYEYEYLYIRYKCQKRQNSTEMRMFNVP